MEWLGLTLAAWAVAMVIVLTGSILQGAMGFGLGLVAAPVLVLLDPTLVPGVVIGMGLPLALIVAWRERRAVDVREIRWAVLGRIPGSIIGSWAVVALGTRALAVGFSLSILTAVGLSLGGLRVTRTPVTVTIAGFASGVTGTATSVGGPPMALLYQHDTGPALRSALAAFFATGALMSLTVLTIVGEFHGRELAVAVSLMPASLIGLALSGRLNRFLDGGHTRAAVLVVAVAAALTIGVRAALGAG
ncbi:MAG: sulfite exporter TauE/SafE family protein [Acidimicrobiales bacterium]